MNTEQSILKELADLKQRVMLIENNLEEYYFNFLSLKAPRRSVEEIIELAVLEYFNVERKRFHKETATRLSDDNFLMARKWFMSLSKNLLLRGCSTMKKDYDFYHHYKVKEHQPIYMAAVNPKNDADYVHRRTYLAILAIARRMCDEEGIFDPRLDL